MLSQQTMVLIIIDFHSHVFIMKLIEFDHMNDGLLTDVPNTTR